MTKPVTVAAGLSAACLLAVLLTACAPTLERWGADDPAALRAAVMTWSADIERDQGGWPVTFPLEGATGDEGSGEVRTVLMQVERVLDATLDRGDHHLVTARLAGWEDGIHHAVWAEFDVEWGDTRYRVREVRLRPTGPRDEVLSAGR